MPAMKRSRRKAVTVPDTSATELVLATSDGPVFDASQTIKKQPARDYVESEEDVALTAWVMSLWDELRSRDETPVPQCPRCGSGRTALLNRAGPRRPLPLFQCCDCGRNYTRMSESPLKKLRHPHKTPDFIRLLSLPLPLNEAGRRMHMDYPAVSNWLMRFRQLIVQNDPEGIWLPRVKLGLRYRPVGTCERCYYHGALHFGGFAPGHRRRVICPECARTWMIDDESNQCMEVQLAYDPALTAARRSRRAGRDAPEYRAPERGLLHVAARAQPPSRVDLAASVVQMHPKPAAHARPRKSQPDAQPAGADDPVLTAFLVAQIERALSLDRHPPPCAHCNSAGTRLHREPRTPAEVPHFICYDCGRTFSRLTGTALERARHRDVVAALVPWLSRNVAFNDAARALGTTPVFVHARVNRFRQWLRVLDPGGDMQARIRIWEPQ
jgi:transposase-like protein